MRYVSVYEAGIKTIYNMRCPYISKIYSFLIFQIKTNWNVEILFVRSKGQTTQKTMTQFFLFPLRRLPFVEM